MQRTVSRAQYVLKVLLNPNHSINQSYNITSFLCKLYGL